MWWSFYNWSINTGFSTAILDFICFTLQKERSCLSLNVFMLLLCIFKQIFRPYVRLDIKQGGGQISNVESTYCKYACTMSLDGAPPKQKQFMDNLPKFCLSRNGAYPKFKVLVHFCWLDQIYPLKAQNIAKSDFMFSCCFYVFSNNFLCHTGRY